MGPPCPLRNRAATSAYLLVPISTDGDHRSLPPGRYACELIKEDSGQWRFSRRNLFHVPDYALDGIGTELAGQAEDDLNLRIPGDSLAKS